MKGFSLKRSSGATAGCVWTSSGHQHPEVIQRGAIQGFVLTRYRHHGEQGAELQFWPQTRARAVCVLEGWNVEALQDCHQCFGYKHPVTWSRALLPDCICSATDLRSSRAVRCLRRSGRRPRIRLSLHRSLPSAPPPLDLSLAAASGLKVIMDMAQRIKPAHWRKLKARAHARRRL